MNIKIFGHKLREKQARIRMSGAFLTVTVVALLAWASTVVEVLPCPVCEGTGVLSGPKSLEVKGFESKEISYTVFQLGSCDEWEQLTYEVNILVVNREADTSAGYLVVDFYLPVSEEPEAEGYLSYEIPIYVEIPPETTKNIKRTLVWEGFMTLRIRPWLVVKEGEEFACPHCNGQGRLSVIEYIKAKAIIR